MNIKSILWFCIPLSLAVSIISAIFTYQFTSSIGLEVGSPVLFGVLGIVLDLSKTVSPIITSHLFKLKKFFAFTFSIILTLSLSILSFSASVANLENSFQATTQNSVEIKNIDSQINLYVKQIDSYSSLAKVQQDSNQPTQAKKSLSKVNDLMQKVSDLNKMKSNVKPTNSFISKFGTYYIYFTSLILELLSWLFMIVLNTKTRETEIDCFEPSSVEVKQIQSSSSKVNSTNDHRFKGQEQQYNEIKNAIIDFKVFPSHPQITKSFKNVSRDMIRAIQSELLEQGILVRYRNGYKYA